MFGLSDEQMKEFERHFKIRIQKFWSPITGFELIEFDDWLQTPDGTSTKDYITQKYSKEASEFVEKLIKIIPFGKE